MTRKNIRAVSRGHDEATVESLCKDPKWGCVSPRSRLANPVNCTMSICDRRSARRCRRMNLGPQHSRTAYRGSTGVELRV